MDTDGFEIGVRFVVRLLVTVSFIVGAAIASLLWYIWVRGVSG